MGSKENTEQNDAELYHRKSTLLQKEHGLDFLCSLNIAEGSKILDLGCGTGNLTVELAKRVGSKGHVLGIDPDKERIRVAKEQIKCENLSFIEADGETFPEDQYDVVFSNYVLHWIDNKDAVFKRVYKNLRPGGVFVFNADINAPQVILEMIEIMGVERGRTIQQNYHFMTMEEYETLAVLTGFNIESKQEHQNPITIPNIDSMFELYSATTKGTFDPKLADKRGLEKLKQKYGDRQIQFEHASAWFVLSKT